MKRLLLFVLWGTLCLIQWGCQETTPAQPQLKVGMDPAIGFPFIYRLEENNKWGGFEYEIADYISRETAHELNIVEVRWEKLLESVAKGEIDLALNAIEKPASPENMELPENIAFTEHYYTAYQKLTVPTSDTFTYGLSDLKGKKVGVIDSSVSQVLLETLNQLKNTNIEVVTFPKPEPLFEALKTKKLNATLTERALASWFSWKSEVIKLTGDPITSAIPYVGVVRKDNKALLSKVNKVLNDAKKDPDFQNIFNKWHVSIKQ